MTTQCVRLALVLTGGVSLAVWMGGVVAEIERAVQRSDGYGVLCDLVETELQVDIIGGSSAGGINGALLGLALARGSDTSSIREVWLRAAALRELLREPSRRPVPSLLKGNEYFQPQLREVFASLYAGDGSPTGTPLEVLLTGTLLDGEKVVVRDDFGSTFTDSMHRALFRFRRDREAGIDDFADPAVVDKLALAARATSAFPGAFEPALCPIGTGGADDLAGHANFSTSSYVIDGGVLVNKPLLPVLDAVLAQPCPGRRVICYVQPAVEQEAAYGIDELPNLARVVRAGWLTLPHAESLSRELHELNAHNARGANRIDLLHISADAPNALDDRCLPVEKLAGLQLQHFGAFYRSAWRANDWMWGRLDATARLVQLLLEPARLRQRAEHDSNFAERVVAAVGGDAEELRDELAFLHDDRLPVPDAVPKLVRTAMRGMQVAITAEELPHIARCAEDDHRVGHHRSPSADVLSGLGSPCDAETTVAAFRACRIGEERLADDHGSVAYDLIVDRVTQLGSALTHRHHDRSLLSRLSGAPRSPLWRAVQASARHRTWAVVLLAGLLTAGAALVVASAWSDVSRIAAIVVGTLIAATGALAAAVLARRVRATLIATLASVIIAVALAFVGPWQWRAWLLSAVLVDVALSLRRRVERWRSERPADPQPARIARASSDS
jgi:predicted acylesterase/phospholipase RssA